MNREQRITHWANKLMAAENAFVDSEDGSKQEQTALNNMDIAHEKLVDLGVDPLVRPIK
jgi:hypothetical protein